MINNSDIERMSQAIQLARLGQYTTRPNPNVGCVITDQNNNFIASGYHRQAGQAHAEILALQAAAERAQNSTVYVTLEPCCHQGKTGPCVEALIAAKVKRVVLAMQDPNPLVAGKGRAALLAAGIQVDSDVCRDQAQALNRGFIKRMQTGLPWVTIKTASSLDGRTALANGCSQWITSAAARRDVHTMRARYDAIMTGIGTVLADDPSLNVRSADIEQVVQPLRVVMDPNLTMPSDAKMLGLAGQTLVFTDKNSSDIDLKLSQQCEIMPLDTHNGRFDMRTVLTCLGAREINNVMVEAGSTLCGALITHHCVDEIVHYLAPTYLGEGQREAANKGMFNLGSLTAIDQGIGLTITDQRNIGVDVRITASISYSTK